MFEPTEIKSYSTRKILKFSLASIIVISCLVILMLLPTFLIFLEGGFSNRQVYSVKSPDSSYELTVSKKVNFPIIDFIDPSIIATVSIIRLDNKKQIESFQIKLLENSDLQEPKTVWKKDDLQISEIDRRNNQTFQVILNKN